MRVQKYCPRIYKISLTRNFLTNNSKSPTTGTTAGNSPTRNSTTRNTTTTYLRPKIDRPKKMIYGGVCEVAKGSVSNRSITPEVVPGSYLTEGVR